MSFKFHWKKWQANYQSKCEGLANFVSAMEHASCKRLSHRSLRSVFIALPLAASGSSARTSLGVLFWWDLGCLFLRCFLLALCASAWLGRASIWLRRSGGLLLLRPAASSQRTRDFDMDRMSVTLMLEGRT